MVEQTSQQVSSNEQRRSPEQSHIREIYERIPANGLALHATTSTRAKKILEGGLDPLWELHFYCLTPIHDWTLNPLPSVDLFESTIENLKYFAEQKKHDDLQQDATGSVVVFEPNFALRTYWGNKPREDGIIYIRHGHR